MSARDGRPSRLRRLTALAEQAASREHILERLKSGSMHALLSVTAAVVAYIPPSSLGLQEGFWAAITALAVTQAELSATHSTARDQFLGAAIGGAVGAAFAYMLGHSLPVFALAAFIALVLAWLTNAPSAARLAGITVTIIMLVPHKTSDLTMLASRFGEVTWGIVAALIVATPVSMLRAHLEARHREASERQAD